VDALLVGINGPAAPANRVFEQIEPGTSLLLYCLSLAVAPAKATSNGKSRLVRLRGLDDVIAPMLTIHSEVAGMSDDVQEKWTPMWSWHCCRTVSLHVSPLYVASGPRRRCGGVHGAEDGEGVVDTTSSRPARVRTATADGSARAVGDR